MRTVLLITSITLLAAPLSAAARQPADTATTRAAAIDIRRTEATREHPEIIAWTVAPQPPPVPALRWTLLPPDVERVSGNAAALYRMALLLYEPPNLKEQYPGQDIKEANEYLAMPIGQVPVRDARLHTGLSAMQHLDWAARRDHVDWGWPLREQGFSALLPELNETRQLSYKLRLRARIEIIEGRYDDAERSLQTTFALARDISVGGVLVNALVGAGIASGAVEQVRELSAAPGSPNLYWALADLPRPMFPIHQIMDEEAAVMGGSFSIIDEVRTDRFSPKQWERFLEELQEVVPSLSGTPRTLAIGRNADPYSKKFLIATLTAAALPRAKVYLIETGMTRDQIEALSPVQVVAIYFVEEYRKISDEFAKWMRLPFHVGYRHLDAEAMEQLRSAKRNEPLNPLLGLLPAVAPAWESLTKIDRELAAMQTVEAVRAHAAANEGKLPARLEEIVATPAPVDAMTGEPFGYEVKGDTFVLTAPPVSRRKERALHYEVTVRSR